jgi:hypothetical protein
VLAAFLACLPAASAGDEDTGWSSGDHVPREAWQEGQVTIPPLPEQQNLLEVEIGQAAFPFRVFIDSQSLEVGDDGVVRYSLVIVSTSGSRNTSFEGMLCNKREYRRYAYGSVDRWHWLGGSQWQRITRGGDGYRYVLYRHYLCNPAGINPGVDGILQRIRYPRDVYLDD